MPPRNTRRIPTGPRYPRSTLPWPATSPPSWCKPTGRSRWRWPRGRRLAWPSSTSSARTTRAGAGICCTPAGPTCSASWDAPPRQARRTGPRSHWTRRPPSASSSPGGSRASKAASRDPAALRRRHPARLLERELRAAFGLGTGTEDAPLGLLDRDVVDAGLPAAHQAVLIELPEFVAVAAPPPARRVVALVLEADRDPVPVEGPQVLAQGVVELAIPLGGEELDDRVAPGEEGVPVTPGRVRGVGTRDPLGVARVPGILGGLHLGQGAFTVEGRQRRSVGHEPPPFFN